MRRSIHVHICTVTYRPRYLQLCVSSPKLPSSHVTRRNISASNPFGFAVLHLARFRFFVLRARSNSHRALANHHVPRLARSTAMWEVTAAGNW